MVGHVDADVVQPFAMLREVIGEDARPIQRLHQLDLRAIFPGQRMAQAKTCRRTHVVHVLQDVG